MLGGKEPEFDGSAAAADWLAEKYSVSNGECVDLPDETVSLCEEYSEITEQIETLSAEKDALSNRLKSLLRDNEVGIAGRFKVSWKSVDSSRFDSTRFKADNPELYGKYIKHSSYRRFGVTGGAT